MTQPNLHEAKRARGAPRPEATSTRTDGDVDAGGDASPDDEAETRDVLLARFAAALPSRPAPDAGGWVASVPQALESEMETREAALAWAAAALETPSAAPAGERRRFEDAAFPANASSIDGKRGDRAAGLPLLRERAAARDQVPLRRTRERQGGVQGGQKPRPLVLRVRDAGCLALSERRRESLFFFLVGRRRAFVRERARDAVAPVRPAALPAKRRSSPAGGPVPALRRAAGRRGRLLAPQRAGGDRREGRPRGPPRAPDARRVPMRKSRRRRRRRARAHGAGAYFLRLFLDGKWQGLVVDSRLPVRGADTQVLRGANAAGSRRRKADADEFRPAYSRAAGNQLWVPLVEKAHAKAHGSYHAISGGWISEGLVDLTGCPTESLRLRGRVGAGSSERLDAIWARLLSYAAARFPMGCATHRGDAARGIVGGHAYSVMDVREVRGLTKGRQTTLGESRIGCSEIVAEEEAETARSPRTKPCVWFACATRGGARSGTASGEPGARCGRRSWARSSGTSARTTGRSG